MPFTARFAGTCNECSAPIKAGQLINWSRRERGKVYHVDCKAIAPYADILGIKMKDGIGTLVHARDTLVKAAINDMLVRAGDALDKSDIVSGIAGMEVKYRAGLPIPTFGRSVRDISSEPTNISHVIDDAKRRLKLKPKKETGIAALRSTSDWTDLFSAVLPFVHRVLLIGPPGTGKSTAAMQIAQCKHRITMTETTSEDALLGMWHLRDNKTIWSDGPLTLAMKQGNPVLVDEIDHYSPEAASLLYSLIDDNPHVETPEGSVSAKTGYKMIMTANEGLETLPVAVQDRIEVVIRANTPAREALEGLPESLQALTGGYYRALPRTPIQLPSSIRRVRTFHSLVKAGFRFEVAALLVFGDNKEIASVLSSIESW